ncbi:MAG TPA: hypothetical protein VLI05_06770 [Candidatus Saccharimonadia bacterium]|nr:hypothetical protein [Candidatus Saccharimonadia bacterium]
MHLPAFSPNIIIIAVLVVVGLYGLLAGQHRLRIFILSIYVGIVLAEQMGSLLRPYLHMLGDDQVAWVLLGGPILIFGLAGYHRHVPGQKKGSAIANLVVSFMAGALILSSALHLLPPSEQASIDGDSYFAMLLGQYHLWLLGLLPVVVLLFGLFGAKAKHP